MANLQPIPLKLPIRGVVSNASQSDPAPDSLYAASDFFPRDTKTNRPRLSVRPGFAAFGSQADAVGFAILGDAFNETGGIQLFAMTSSALKKYTIGSGWSNVGTITTSSSRTIHAASYGKVLYIACNDPYKKCDYDSNNNGTADWTISTWAADTAGTIPPNCRIVARHGGRIVLLADPANPHIVNFSRSDDPLDWDFTAEDTEAAIALPIDEAATAGFSHNRNCFVVGTKNGMWSILGNPTSNGVVQKFEFSGGPINSTAWCKGNDGWTYVLTHNGLFKMAPDCGSPLQQVSRNLIPDNLIGLDGTNSTAVLLYDERFRCVHIYVSGTNAQYWLYDVDGEGFWPITTPGTSILAGIRFGMADSATASGTLVGTHGGVMRLDSATALGGSTAAYATRVVKVAEPGQKALISSASFDFGTNTDDPGGTYTLYGGETAASAIAKTNGRKTPGYTIASLLANHGTCLPRIGGQYVLVDLVQSDTSKHISVEDATLFALPNGMERG